MKLMLIITYIFIYMGFAAIIRMILDFDMYDKPVLELVCTILWPLYIFYAVFYIALIHPIGEIIKRERNKRNEHKKG